MTTSIESYLALLPEAAREGGLLFLDAETQSELDLRKVGTPRYTTQCRIMCWAWALDDGPIQLYRPGTDIEWLTGHTGGFVAHNIEFERRLLLHHYSLDIPPERWIDSAAVARFNNLPGGLEDLGAFFGFPKDTDGSRVMLKLSKPRRLSKDNREPFWTPATKPGDFERLYEYCKRDVEVSRYALEQMHPPSPIEKRVMDLTVKMNETGIEIDLDNVHRAHALVVADRKKLSDKVRLLTGGISASQVGELARYLHLDSVDKATIRDTLKQPDLDFETRFILELREAYAKASTRKLDAFMNRSLDGRIHDGLVYGGAERTLRWSGFGIQPQNMPRGAGEKTDGLFEKLEAGTLPDVQENVRDMVRGFITGPFFIGDFSQVEARTLAHMAGDERMLDAFATGKDPYRLQAADIYHVEPDEVSDAQRFMGKQVVLGCGYGLGKHGFRYLLDKTYDVQIDEDEAERIVKTYRRTSAPVKKLWDRIERGVRRAFQKPGKLLAIVEGLAVKATSSDSFFLRLPSGRKLYYRQVSMGKQMTAFGRLPNGGYGETKLYGGKLTGHVIQSIARDLMAEALLRLEDAGYVCVLTVHDEAVVLAEPTFFEHFVSIMREVPPWAAGLPLEVDCFETYRYRK